MPDIYPVGSPEFIAECLAAFSTCEIPNLGGMYERVQAGEKLSAAQLKAMGYGYFDARNIAAFISHEHKGLYANALGWE